MIQEPIVILANGDFPTHPTTLGMLTDAQTIICCDGAINELNKKESPRLDIAIKFLRMIGIKVVRNIDDIKIYGKPKIDLKRNYHIKNFLKDHRIFMMSCIAALTLGGNWKINDKDSINTSFPKFLNILKNLGANIN